MATIGQLTYVVDAQTKNLNNVVKEVQRLSKTLERTNQTLNRLAQTNQKAFSAMSKAAQGSAKTQQKASSSSEKALARQNKAIESARERFQSLRKTVKESATGSASQLGRLQRSFNSLERRLKRGVASTNEFNKAQARFKKVSSSVAAEVKRSEKAHQANVAQLRRQSQATQSARQRTAQLISQLRQMGASREQVRKLAGSFRNYEKRLRSGAMSTQQFQQTQANFNKRLGVFRSQLGQLKIKKQARDTTFWKQSVQDLTKSVQVALGPLSGVAARITAMSALFQTNTAIIAAAVGAITGFAVALGAAINAGNKFEQEMRRIEGVLDVMGERAAVTAEEINNLARQLARGTLASANEARRASALLASFGDIGREIFQETLEAAQGLSVLMGGALQLNIRRLGRLLQDPVDQMSALSRAGIRFSETQELMIESLVRGGKLLEAQQFLLGELQPLIRAAKNETKGLAGAWDTMVESGREFLEVVADQSGLMETVRKAVQAVADEFDLLRTATAAAQNVGQAFNAVAGLMASTLVTLLRNLDLVIAAITGFFVGGAASTVIRNLDNMRIGLAALGSAMTATAGATRNAAVAFRAFRRFVTLALGPIGILVGILTQIALRSDSSEKSLEQLGSTAVGTAQRIRNLSGELEELNEEERERITLERSQARSDLRAIEASLRRREESIVSLRRTAEEELAKVREQLSPFTIEVGPGRTRFLEEGIPGVEQLTDDLAEAQRQARQLRTLENVLEGVSEGTLDTQEAIAALDFEGSTKQIENWRTELQTAIANADDLEEALEAMKEALEGANNEITKATDITEDNIFNVTELINNLPDVSIGLKEWKRNQELVNLITEDTNAVLERLDEVLKKVGVKEADRDKIMQAVAGSTDQLIERQKALIDPTREFGDEAGEVSDEVESMIDAIRDLAFESETAKGGLEALRRGGSRALELFGRKREIDEFRRDITETVSELGKEGRKEARGLLSTLFPDIATEGKTIVEIMEDAKEQTQRFNTEAEALEETQGAFRDLTIDVDASRRELQLLNEQGLRGLEVAEQERTVADFRREIEKMVDDLSDADRAQFLKDLQERFPNLVAGTDNLAEAFARVRAEQERINEETEFLEKTITDVRDLAEDSMDRVAQAIGNAMALGREEVVDFGQVFTAIINDMLVQIARLSLVRPLQNAFGANQPDITSVLGLLFGGGDGGGGGVTAGDFVPSSQKGNVFGKPSLTTVAERGSEAVVPLPDGRSIPVSLQGGGGGDTMPVVVINDQRGPDAPPIEQSETQVDGRRALELTIRDVVNRNLVRGEHDSALNSRFRVNPRRRGT